MSERVLTDVVDEAWAKPPLDSLDGVDLEVRPVLCRRLAREALLVVA